MGAAFLHSSGYHFQFLNFDNDTALNFVYQFDWVFNWGRYFSKRRV